MTILGRGSDLIVPMKARGFYSRIYGTYTNVSDVDTVHVS